MIIVRHTRVIYAGVCKTVGVYVVDGVDTDAAAERVRVAYAAAHPVAMFGDRFEALVVPSDAVQIARYNDVVIDLL